MPTHAGNGFVVSQQTVNPATNIILASTIAIYSTTSLTIAATRSLVIIIITAMIKTYHYLVPFRLLHKLRHFVIALRRLLLLFI